MLEFCRWELSVKAKREFIVVIERDESGHYVAHVPALQGCYTQRTT
jgi:predicted RNase H-like HicB family nuclease